MLRPQNTSLGLLAPLFVAGGVLLVIVATSWNTVTAPRYDEDSLSGAELALASGTQSVGDGAPGAGVGGYVPLKGLIDPNNGDNGTSPAQTTTGECAGQYDLPVLAGVDLVEYWRLAHGADPVQGNPNLMSVFEGYRFYFSCIENLRSFESDPLKYIPAYGGFCSYGIANEPMWTDSTLGPFGNPAKWKIYRDGRLHVFRSTVPMEEFEEDVPGNIERGNAVWRGWFEDSGPVLNTACFCDDNMCADQ